MPVWSTNQSLIPALVTSNWSFSNDSWYSNAVDERGSNPLLDYLLYWKPSSCFSNQIVRQTWTFWTQGMHVFQYKMFFPEQMILPIGSLCYLKWQIPIFWKEHNYKRKYKLQFTFWCKILLQWNKWLHKCAVTIRFKHPYKIYFTGFCQ